MKDRLIITFREDGYRIEGTITKPQMVMVSADILATVLFLATSNEERDKIGEEFISQLTESFRSFESGESNG